MALTLAVLAALPVSIRTADLQPETLAGFSRYVQAAEARIAKEESNPGSFLYFNQLPPAQRDPIIGSLKHGHVFITRLTTLDSSGRTIEVPGGLVHHWLGIVFIRGASLRHVLNTVQDYNHQRDDYRPQVIRSRLLARQGDDFKVYLRLQESKVITITLDTWHDVRYSTLDTTHVSSRSYSTRIQEVGNAGGQGEYLMPVGHDGGFLWRINSYWRFEERDGGVYVQCESISLTRDIPTGFGWLVGPFVTSIPRETLENTLSETRAAVLKRR
ncbi:MAG: hypothetical protein ACRD18_04115 [Terriglobia bacterium]